MTLVESNMHITWYNSHITLYSKSTSKWQFNFRALACQLRIFFLLKWLLHHGSNKAYQTVPRECNNTMCVYCSEFLSINFEGIICSKGSSWKYLQENWISTAIMETLLSGCLEMKKILLVMFLLKCKLVEVSMENGLWLWIVELQHLYRMFCCRGAGICNLYFCYPRNYETEFNASIWKHISARSEDWAGSTTSVCTAMMMHREI